MSFIVGDFTGIRALVQNHTESIGRQMLTQRLVFDPREDDLCSSSRHLKRKRTTGY